MIVFATLIKITQILIDIQFYPPLWRKTEFLHNSRKFYFPASASNFSPKILVIFLLYKSPSLVRIVFRFAIRSFVTKLNKFGIPSFYPIS